MTTVRDLGYRAYEGELRPPTRNLWVMMRHGLWRIWGSWINRIVVFFCWIPLLVLALVAFARFGALGPELPEIPEGATGFGRWFLSPPAVWMRTLTGIQFWFCASIVTIRSGAGVIAEDLTNRAYQFYFAKPVTPIQYLAGRTGALALVVGLLVFVPVAILGAILVGLGPEAERLERVGLLLPALFDATLIAVCTSSLAVASSALSSSRALTLTAWTLILVVPFALAFLVQSIGHVEWVFAASLPGALWCVGDALYKVSGDWTDLKWLHAAPILAIAVGAASYGALVRIRRAEVIT
ncbi:MAG: hypothetical protein KF729_00865 [Sandaracinaceae bacterium]|nr:hypothetical protein [Sandaracinaceae bacterium]